MIIFGTQGIHSTIGKGQFGCPQCATSEPYEHKKVTKSIVLFFIPMIPLGRTGDYVECQSCKGTFDSSILGYDPEDVSSGFKSEYEKALRHSMVMMMLADGEIGHGEMNAVLRVINKYGHHSMSKAQLEKYVKEVESENEGIEKYLKKVAPSLNEQGKEIIVKGAMAVAASDANIDDTEVQLIYKMAEVMEMSPSHLKRIFNEMTKR